MFTANQFICHAVGDYILQSDWMALNKTKSWFPAFVHAITYSIPFLLLKPSVAALIVIIVSHAIIDRLRLARFVVWAKNLIAPKGQRTKPWSECKGTGYDPARPEWLTVWLLIIADNIIHVIINACALRWL